MGGGEPLIRVEGVQPVGVCAREEGCFEGVFRGACIAEALVHEAGNGGGRGGADGCSPILCAYHVPVAAGYAVPYPKKEEEGLHKSQDGGIEGDPGFYHCHEVPQTQKSEELYEPQHPK